MALSNYAGVAKLADAQDLKSRWPTSQEAASNCKALRPWDLADGAQCRAEQRDALNCGLN